MPTLSPSLPARSGGRHITDAHLKALRSAQSFTGLPDRVHRFTLIRLLRSCGKRLGFSTVLIKHLELLVGFTKEEDWHGDCPRPFVFLAVDDPRREHCLTSLLNVSRQQINRLERKLVQLGALVHHDSGNLQRYRNRFDTYGLDLRPLGALYPVLLQEARQQEEEEHTRQQLCQTISSLRRRIKGAVLGGQLPGQTLNDPALVYRLRPSSSLAELQELTRSLSRLWQGCSPSSDPQQPRKRLHQRHQKASRTSPKRVTQLYDKQSPDQSYKAMTLRRHDAIGSQDTAKKGKRINLGDVSSRHNQSSSGSPWWQAIAPPDLHDLLQDIHELPALFPLMDRLRGRFGVSPHAWRTAVHALGQDLAAQCLLVAITKHERGSVHTVGGYLTGMVRRYRSGGLDLAGSIRVLLAQPGPLEHQTDEPGNLGRLARRIINTHGCLHPGASS